MLTKRLIACLDVVKGAVTKARQFQDNVYVGPVDTVSARLYDDQIDEVIFYDITASSEKRPIDIDAVARVAKVIFIPFTVGGGIKSVEEMRRVIKAGAEKVSIDSMAVRNPQIICEGALAFGRQCIVLSMQVKRVGKSAKIASGYETAIDGARVFTGMDAVEWARRGEDLGAGEIVVNSIDRDGTHEGFDIEITSMISSAVNIPVIASGGAGKTVHLVDVFTRTGASAAIISSMLYSPFIPNVRVRDLKEELAQAGIPVRPWVEGY